MRAFTLAFVLACLPVALSAEVIEAGAPIDRVTLYPWGATLIRRVEVSLPAGVHELVIPGLPTDTDAGSLRVGASEGVTIGAVNLAYGRLPVTADVKRPEILAAEAEIERLEGILRDKDAAIAATRLAVDAANERVAFLRGLGQGKAAEGLSAGAVEELRALARMVGDEVLAARLAAHQAEQAAGAAERAKKDDIEALDKARQALAALQAEAEGKAVLTMSVGGAGGAAVLEITTFTGNANWRPVYDLRLARLAGTPGLAMERGVLVAQMTGEDWRGVELTFSTARPAEQSMPTDVHPWLRRIYSESEGGFAEGASDRAVPAAPKADTAMEMAEPMIVAEAASLEMMGATVTYRYATRVDIRNGVESLRLNLDTLHLSPGLVAVAVPSRDASAFLVAELVNTTPEPILPGDATFYLDGVMIGTGWIDLLAAGDEADLGFGPIDGIRLTRTVPERSEGDRGIITSSNLIDEVAVLEVENLTAETWPLRVIDQVPYSEQEDLEISHVATPPATVTDLDDKRGVLAWEFDLAPGETREIRLEHSLSWPSGYGLQ